MKICCTAASIELYKYTALVSICNRIYVHRNIARNPEMGARAETAAEPALSEVDGAVYPAKRALTLGKMKFGNETIYRRN